ncbi:MAG: hypothetical protein WCP35_21090, partial [Verrucomicrobiota bacterium]
GMADQHAREDRDGLTKEIQELQELAGKREAELTGFKVAAPVNRKIRKLVTDFLVMVAALPHVMATLKRVPGLRELFASLAPLVGVKLDLDPVDMPEAVTPVKVVLGVARATVEKAADGKKSVHAAPEVAAGPNMEK